MRNLYEEIKYLPKQKAPGLYGPIGKLYQTLKEGMY
jgi:hypothetical protein